jgi:hypothetical protein
MSQRVGWVCPFVGQGAPQVVVVQWKCWGVPRRREGQKAGGRNLGWRDHVLYLAHVDYGSGMIGDIDVVIVLGAERS